MEYFEILHAVFYVEHLWVYDLDRPFFLFFVLYKTVVFLLFVSICFELI